MAKTPTTSKPPESADPATCRVERIADPADLPALPCCYIADGRGMPFKCDPNVVVRSLLADDRFLAHAAGGGVGINFIKDAAAAATGRPDLDNGTLERILDVVIEHAKLHGVFLGPPVSQARCVPGAMARGR